MTVLLRTVNRGLRWLGLILVVEMTTEAGEQPWTKLILTSRHAYRKRHGGWLVGDPE